MSVIFRGREQVQQYIQTIQKLGSRKGVYFNVDVDLCGNHA